MQKYVTQVMEKLRNQRTVRQPRDERQQEAPATLWAAGKPQEPRSQPCLAEGGPTTKEIQPVPETLPKEEMGAYSSFFTPIWASTSASH